MSHDKSGKDRHHEDAIAVLDRAGPKVPPARREAALPTTASPAASTAAARPTADRDAVTVPPSGAERRRVAPADAKPRRAAAKRAAPKARVMPAAEPTVPDAAAVPAVAIDAMSVVTPAAAPATAAASAVAGFTKPQTATREPPRQITAPAPLPRSRAPTLADGRLIRKVTAWLGKLAPRKRRAPLAQARTRLPAAQHAAPARPATTAPPDDDMLARQTLLQLSEENARLRRELDMLRAAPASV